MGQGHMEWGRHLMRCPAAGMAADPAPLPGIAVALGRATWSVGTAGTAGCGHKRALAWAWAGGEEARAAAMLAPWQPSHTGLMPADPRTASPHAPPLPQRQAAAVHRVHGNLRVQGVHAAGPAGEEVQVGGRSHAFVSITPAMHW